MKKVLIAALLLISTPAMADPYTYKPASCEFNTVFPEKPFIEVKCPKDKPDDCEEVATFTKTLDASALSFRLSCRKASATDLSLLKPEDLKKRLAALVKQANLEPFTSDSALLEGNVKTSIALATGRRNERDVIYTGQMWLGKSSIFTMEGEMTGPESEEINNAYTEILRSVKNSSAKPKAPKAEPKKTP